MKPPEEVKLSREDGEALIERIKASNLASDDQGLLVKLIQVYFWLMLAFQETKISLKRLKVALFGKRPKKPKPPEGGSGGIAAGAEITPAPTEPPPTSLAAKSSGEDPSAERRVATAAGVPRPIRALKRSYAVITPLGPVNVVRRVAAARYTRCPRGSRSGLTATRCSRRCAKS
jgi:hypothetical protein